MAYTSRTLAQLLPDLTVKWEGAPFWTAADAALAIREALRVWNAYTGYWRTRVVAPLLPRDPFVALPGLLVQGATVAVGGRPLVGPVGLEALGRMHPNWRRTHGTDPPRLWAPVGLGALVVYPALTAGGSAEVDGVRNTPVPVLDDDLIDLEDALFSVILGEALHVAAFKVGAALLRQTEPFHQAFYLAAADRNAELRSTDYYRHLIRERRLQGRTADAAPVAAEEVS